MKNWIAGFIAGALLFMLVPAQAHHRYNYDRLKYRISILEQTVSHIGYPTAQFDPAWIDLPSGCSGEPAVWDFTTDKGLGC